MTVRDNMVYINRHIEYRGNVDEACQIASAVEFSSLPGIPATLGQLRELVYRCMLIGAREGASQFAEFLYSDSFSYVKSVLGEFPRTIEGEADSTGMGTGIEE